MNMPSSSLKGDVKYMSKDYHFEFIRNENSRDIKIHVNQFENQDAIDVALTFSYNFV